MSLGGVLLRPVGGPPRGRRCRGRVDFVVTVIVLFLTLSTLLTLCRCENDIDECKIGPNCQNNGTCTDLVNGYNCTCTDKFTGDDCQFRINQTCDTLSCKNGTCIKLNYTDHSGNNYEVVNCSCDAGFEGKECEIEIDFCEDVICKNHANCTTNKQRTAFVCNCDNDHEGIYCEKEIDHCSPKPCKNGATCEDVIGDFICKCQKGWEGKSCDIDINECLNRTEMCLHKGVCINLNGSFDCNCTGTGYGGSLCEKKGRCLDQPCANNATCEQNIAADTYKCMCAPGFMGQNCSEDIKECQSNPCLNNGACNETYGSYHCICDEKNFLGKNCHIVNPCSPEKNPCMNGANCSYTVDENENNADAICACPGGFQGPTCVEKLIAGMPLSNLYLYIGIPLALLLLAIIIGGVAYFVMNARKKRATSGTYSPSRQEMSGSRVELGNVIKIPPTERLI